jgi:hypothetical protein
MGHRQPCGKTHARPARQTGGDSGEIEKNVGFYLNVGRHSHQARTNTEMIRLMKWLLGNWCGRLYLVVQIICVATTTYLCVEFVNKDAEKEISDIRCFWQMTEATPNSDGTMPQGKALEKLKQRDVVFCRQNHSNERQQFILRYSLYNLGVPALWTVGLFIAKGFPASKTAR